MVLSPVEIPLGEQLAIKVFELPTFDSTAKEKELNNMAEYLKKAAELDSIGKAQEKRLAAIEDSLSRLNAEALAQATANKEMQTQKERQEKIGEIKQAIEYPDSTNYVLDPFFKSLQDLSKNPNLIRVVHYGDSQVEGDRITEYLRSRLQSRFGGCGVGIVPMVEKQAFRNTLASDESDNWNKFAVYGVNASKAGRPYGLLGAYYRFAAPLEKDSTSDAHYKAWLRLKDAGNGGKTDRSTQIENFKILYNSSKSELATTIKIESQGKNSKDTTFKYKLEQQEAKGELAVFEQVIESKFKKMHIAFDSESGSEIYGMALDCNTGIAIDNVALRGSAGIEFTKMNKDFLRQHIKQLNVKLLILQFGVNVVPSPAKDYGFYERLLTKQLRFLKSLAPDLCILVVGVSDMAHKSGTQYVSYSNIPKIREAQRKAAFKTGCAFWDLYEAMGGEGAMRSWVQSKPSLAGKDYTHFNARGARVVGEMLYEALMKSYDEYKLREGSVLP